MRFVLVEELKSLDTALSSKAAQDVQKYGDKVISATEKGSQRKIERNVKKMSKSASKALDALSQEDQNKIKNVRGIFEIAASGGLDTEYFKFLSSLPDEAYQSEENLKYFVDQIDDKVIEVPEKAKTESLEEALNDYFFPYNDKEGIFYNKSLWNMSTRDFETVLDAYNKLNSKRYAEKVFGEKRANREAIKDVFTDSSGNVRQAKDIGSQIETEVKNFNKETQEAKKTNIENYSKSKGYASPYHLLSDLIKRNHKKLTYSEKGGEQDEGYYLYALESLWRNYTSTKKFKDNSMGKKKKDLMSYILKEIKYTNPKEMKILSDFERVVDDSVRKGNLSFNRRG